MKLSTISTKQKAALVVYYICSPDTAGEIQQRVHPNFAKMLATVRIDGLKNIGNDIFIMSEELTEKAKAWYADSAIKAEANKIFKQFGN